MSGPAFDELALSTGAVRHFAEAMARIRSSASTQEVELALWAEYLNAQGDAVTGSPQIAQIVSDLTHVLMETSAHVYAHEPTAAAPSPGSGLSDDSPLSGVRGSGRVNDLRRLRVNHPSRRSSGDGGFVACAPMPLPQPPPAPSGGSAEGQQLHWRQHEGGGGGSGSDTEDACPPAPPREEGLPYDLTEEDNVGFKLE